MMVTTHILIAAIGLFMARNRPGLYILRREQLSSDRTRLFVGQYMVDFHQRNDVTYYAISKEGHADILSMGHEQNPQDAEASARWTISELEKATYKPSLSA
jgi:hypothetical protein